MAPQTSNQQVLQDYFTSHGERLSQSQRVALEDFALWLDDAKQGYVPHWKPGDETTPYLHGTELRDQIHVALPDTRSPE